MTSAHHRSRRSFATALVCGLSLVAACRSKPELPSPQAQASSSARPSGSALSDGEVDLTKLLQRAPAPYIPPQCYTKTKDERGVIHNPCYTCHSEPQKPNYVVDADLQLAFAFPERARQNPWTNLFVDRRPFIAATSDEKMLKYVRTSNYSNGKRNLLAERLKHAPAAWDRNGDGHWGGYVPDAGFDFDSQGFDKNARGEFTGWRAYAYRPFPGTFWPTNGSAGDVLIRLPEVFRQDEAGKFDQLIYALNLAIVEALAKRSDVAIPRTNEKQLHVDLDKNGRLGTATKVKFEWAPRNKQYMHYVGRARLALEAGEVQLAAGLLPEGTELLHSVRYLDVKDGRVAMAARMKELRYARKVAWKTYSDLEQLAAREVREKRAFPDRVKQVYFDLEGGASNSQGWRYQGFIEDNAGQLRPQSYEETAFCVGCHGGTSATTDGVFSFVRKLSAKQPQYGWYHWTQHGLDTVPDSKRGDGNYEYAHYLQTNGAGDEFRSNEDLLSRFFEKGQPRREELERLRGDVATLIVPSAKRALELDKAYWAVVLEQSYHRGRDAVLAPARNVHRRVEPELPTGVRVPVHASWQRPSLAQR